MVVFMRAVRALPAAVCGLALSAGIAQAQLATSKLYSLHPAGGRAGTTVEVRLTGGEHLYEADSIRFSRPEIVGRLKTIAVGGKSLPVYGTFEVTIPPQVPPGLVDVRIGGPFGLSNPRTFTVDAVPEMLEIEPNDTSDEAATVALGSIVNGLAERDADEDFYIVNVRAGDRVRLLCRAGGIDSRLDPELSLHDADGNLLAGGRPHGRGDVVLDRVAERDERWIVRIADLAFRGGSEFYYRLEVRTGPRVDFVVPPAVVPGVRQRFALYGRNLPGGKPVEGTAGLERLDWEGVPEVAANGAPAAANVPSFSAPVPAADVTFRLGTERVPAVRMALAEGLLSAEVEPNDLPARAQSLTLPADLTGSFGAAEDADVFEFDAKAKEVWEIDVAAQRIGSPADPFLRLERLASPGSEVAELVGEADDRPSGDVPAEICNFAADDPTLRFAVPQTGRYRLTLRDRYSGSRGGPELSYRLTIRRERPDFRLFSLPLSQEDRLDQCIRPQAIVLRPGDRFALAVLAVRQGGFRGEIDIRVEGLPPGVTSAGARLEGNRSVGYLVLETQADRAPYQGEIKIVAEAAGLPPREAVEMTTLRDGTREQRVSRSICHSVMADPAPVSLEADATEFRLAQGSTAMVPLRYVTRLAGASQERLENFPRELAGIVLDNPQAFRKAYAEPGEHTAWGRLTTVEKFPPGTHRIHLKSFSKHYYRAGEAPTARAKQAQAAAKKMQVEAKKSLDAAVAHGAGAETEQARLQFAAVEAWLKATDEHAAAVQRMATTSKYGGRNYHISPVISLHIERAQFTLSAVPRGKLKPGGGTEIQVKIERAKDFRGAVRIELLHSPDTVGLTAEPLVLGPEEVEGTLRLVAAGKVVRSPASWTLVHAVAVEGGSAPLEVPLTLDVSTR